MLLLLACVAPEGGDSPSRDRASHDAADTAPDDSGDTDCGDTDCGDTDSGDPGPTTFACPADMAPVPTDSPAWCVDPYEVTVTDGVAAAIVGVVPTIGVTFEEAAAACAATPALDADGAVYAMRHLATSSEWQDAGDGIVGEGGTAYPWGDAWDDTICVTPATDGTLQFDGLQPTGSMPGCVSATGVYDQIGNAWEWTDSGRLLDADEAIATFAAGALQVSEDPDGIVLVAGDPALLLVEAAGVQPPTVTVTDDGHLEIPDTQVQPDPEHFFARGYLVGAGAMLAVRLEQAGDAADAPWRLFIAREYDGRTIPDKRGCAWYTGTNQGCTLSAASLVHLPDFDGTIGFRCVAPPYPR